MSQLSKRLPVGLRRSFRSLRRGARRRLALLWRLLFRKTTFIGITGSHGKTTATMLLANILRSRAETRVGLWFNEPHAVVRSVLKARPWRHRFMVQEVSGHYPGAAAESASVLRPLVGVVTAVGGDHRKSFGGSLEATASEKARLISCLPDDGLAVLNADDPYVAAMATTAPCRVVRYGGGSNVDLRLIEARSEWPERLSLTVEYKGEQFEVKTQLVGEHWTVSVMAALLTALELGIPRMDCIRAIEATEPAYNRMSVHPSPHGGWYVLDAFKSSFFGIEACLKFLGNAEAPRRTVVVGTISDYPGASKAHYYKVARMALAVADRVIFTGRNAERVRRLAAGEYAGRLFTAEEPIDAIEILEKDAVAGELIYVKATRIDELARLLAPRPAESRNRRSDKRKDD